LENGKILKSMRFKIKKIKNDASFREFFRLIKGKKTSIIVRAKKEKFKNLIAYSAINNFLRNKGVYTPKLISKDFKLGVMEIEDFGNNTLAHNIKKSKVKFSLYKKSVNTIFKIQKIKPIKKIKINSNQHLNLDNYNKFQLHKETDLFFDWYLNGIIGKKKTTKFKQKIRLELNSLYKQIVIKNKFVVHRDFHVSNLMLKKKRLGVIDTQDMILGNPMYDLASLIDDVRIKVPIKIKNKTFQYYLNNCSIERKNRIFLKNDFDILSVQRNLKILGIFYRLYKRDNKPQYLKYLPYTWKLIEFRIKNKIFKNLDKLLREAVSKKIRKKINF
tara:strand:+ start:590 stop:1579 length:990 start_codon:yes stop_codon:yes gene_type:complete